MGRVWSWGRKPVSLKDADEWREKQKRWLFDCQVSIPQPRGTAVVPHSGPRDRTAERDISSSNHAHIYEPKLWPSKAFPWSCVKHFPMRNIFSWALKGRQGTTEQEKGISPLLCLFGFCGPQPHLSDLPPCPLIPFFSIKMSTCLINLSLLPWPYWFYFFTYYCALVL